MAEEKEVWGGFDEKTHKELHEKKVKQQNEDIEEEQETLEDVGDIHIADEVISIVASLAAQEVHGVVGMSGGITDGINSYLGRENASKGVRLKFTGKTVNASVYIIIEYGCSIPEVALEVQEKVKEAIEGMTGYDVQFVDVNVEGVSRRQQTELEKEAAPEDAMIDIVDAQNKHAQATVANSFEEQLANLRGDGAFELDMNEEDAMDERQLKFWEED